MGCESFLFLFLTLATVLSSLSPPLLLFTNDRGHGGGPGIQGLWLDSLITLEHRPHLAITSSVYHYNHYHLPPPPPSLSPLPTPTPRTRLRPIRPIPVGSTAPLTPPGSQHRPLKFHYPTNLPVLPQLPNRTRHKRNDLRQYIHLHPHH